MSFFGRSGYMSRCGRFGFVALSLGIGLYVAGTARAVVIDDFTAGAQSATADGEELDLSQSGLPTANVIGGTRGVELWGNGGVTSLEIDTSGEGKAVFEVTSGNGYLTLTYGSEAQPLTWTSPRSATTRYKSATGSPTPTPCGSAMPGTASTARAIRSACRSTTPPARTSSRCSARSRQAMT